MPVAAKPITRLLIVSTGAGSVTDEVQAKLARAFPDFRMVEFNPRQDFTGMITPRATVIVAGGDGTIGFVARALAGSKRRLGILSLGTFNNFARGLGLPEDVDKAIKVIRQGKARPVTLGEVDGMPFLEAAAIGFFGDAIALGDKAKEGELGKVTKDLRAVAGASPFEYQISGDLEGHGRALSLVFSNTPSIGARVPVGDKTPTAPFLELSVRVGASRADVVGRVLASTLLDKHVDDEGMGFHFRSITVHTKPRISVYGDNLRAGRTPVTIRANPGALRVILPAT
jgi:diacylglycerol kinase family enzyme